MLRADHRPDPAPPFPYWRDPASDGRVDTDFDAPKAIDFELLAQYLPIPCWIARGDGYITWYNKRWHDYCGTTPEAVEGWGWQSVHDPAVLTEVMERWPAAIASGEPFEMVFPLRGADGVYRRFLTRIIPLRDAGGSVVRWFGTNTEVEKEIAAEEALIASEAKFEALTNAMPQMVWTASPDGLVNYYNQHCYDFTGLAPGTADAESWIGLVHPDDRETAISAWTGSVETGEPYSVEYRILDHAGAYRYIAARGTAERNRDGAIVRWFGTCTDIDDTKRDAQHTELLSRELSHRIKNIFAVVGGLIGLSAYRDPSAKGFAASLSARVAALARAHNFARPHSDMSRPVTGETSLQGLLRELIAPYDYGDDAFTLGGEDVPIDERSATPIALVFHELATNAAKYGALSADSGRVAIEVARDNGCVRIDWRESGGPRVAAPPTHQGFGTELSEVSIEDQLGGRIERDWRPEGLHVRVTVQAERLLLPD